MIMRKAVLSFWSLVSGRTSILLGLLIAGATVAAYIPDTGVSAACPVAAGCVAALRTSNKVKPNAVKPAALFKKLRDTARKPGGGGSGWTPDFGHGIIDPVAAGRALNAIP